MSASRTSVRAEAASGGKAAIPCRACSSQFGVGNQAVQQHLRMAPDPAGWSAGRADAGWGGGVGNLAMQRLGMQRPAMPHWGGRRTVRPKLEVGAINDPLERQADEIAERAVSGEAPCACGGSCGTDKSRSIDILRAPDEAGAARSIDGDRGPEAPGVLGLDDSDLGRLGPGAKLPVSERAFFESRLGVGLDHVRVHDGPQAWPLAKQIGARAFAAGNDLVFARGAYAPGTPQGRRLLGHEIAHTMQTASGAPVRLRRKDDVPAAPTPPATPAAAPAADVSPCLLAVRPLTNGALIETFVQTRAWLHGHKRSGDGYNDRGNLMRRLVRERERRTNQGQSWLGDEISGVPDRLYELRGDPESPLRIRINPIAGGQEAGPPSDHQSAPTMTRAQVMTMLERNGIQGVDPDEHYRDQPAQNAVPLTVDMPPPAQPQLDPISAWMLMQQGGFPTGLGPQADPFAPFMLPTPGGIAGRPPMAFSPTPTAGDSLNAFTARVLAARGGIDSYEDIYRMYSRYPQPLPAPSEEPYRTDMLGLAPPDRMRGVQIGGDITPYRPGAPIPLMDKEAFYHFYPAQGGEIRYRIYVSASPEHAVSVMRVVVQEFVEGSGVPTAKVAAQRIVGVRRDSIVITASDLATVERIVLRMRTLRTENPAWIIADPVPMTDPIMPGVGLGAEPPSHASFGTERSQQIFAALQAAPPGETPEAFQVRVAGVLKAAGVDPAAPHSALDLQNMSPERRLWLQAGGSAMGGYHMGGLRSPAVVGAGFGGAMGLALTSGDVWLHPEQHPHAGFDIATGTGTSALGAYGGGAIDFAMASRFAPVSYTMANASLGLGMRGMVLPRMGGGAAAGAIVAPLMTWAQMGLNQAVYGADYTGIDYAALGTRSLVSGAIGGAGGAGAAALTGFIAGSEVPILGNIVGAGVGLLVYWGADALFGASVEASVRDALGEQGCQGVAVPE